MNTQPGQPFSLVTLSGDLSERALGQIARDTQNAIEQVPGVLSADLKGTREHGRRFIESLRLFSHLANVGDAKSLVIHPASTTHFRMSAEDLRKAGITEGTIRLSVGLEDPEDLKEDLSRALHAAGKA